jgi:cobalt-zinc-cadmium efflux system membrane fusion protein
MKNLILILTLILCITSCGDSTNQQNNEKQDSKENIFSLTDEQLKNVGIETAKLTSKSMSAILKVNGKIDVPPQSLISISVPMGGYLKYSKLLPGSKVTKGQVIATMEDPQYVELQRDYLTAVAQFNFLENEYNRQRELNQSKASSDKIYEQTKASYISQNVLVKSLEAKLKLLGINPTKLTPNSISSSISLYSPINGYVSAVHVNVGKYVTPSEVLFELINPADIHLALTVFEKDINKIHVGQELVAYTNENSNVKFPCSVVLISRNLNDERSAEVHCHFENLDKDLIPGMFMNAEININSNMVKTISEEAIVKFENKSYVFMSKGKNQFEMLEVATGINANGLTELIIKESYWNSSFVTKGAYSLLMKLKNTSDE